MDDILLILCNNAAIEIGNDYLHNLHTKITRFLVLPNRQEGIICVFMYIEI